MSHRLAFVLFALGYTTACGGGDGNDTPPQTIITMSGTVEITGDNTASGGFSTIGYTRRQSCAEYASLGSAPNDPGPVEAEGTFKIPGPTIGVPLEPSGDVYASTLRITPAIYQGPGTYANDDATDQIDGQIVLNEIPDGPAYFLEDGMATASINADGSGTVTFVDIPEDTTGLPTSISGTVTWTCSEDQ